MRTRCPPSRRCGQAAAATLRLPTRLTSTTRRNSSSSSSGNGLAGWTPAPVVARGRLGAGAGVGAAGEVAVDDAAELLLVELGERLGELDAGAVDDAVRLRGVD